MRKSILSPVLVIFVIVITLVVVAEWFPLHNIRKFSGEFVKVLNIALIKPTFTGAAYHKSFYNFYFICSSVPHARAGDGMRSFRSKVILFRIFQANLIDLV